jgi:hypothetical protein
MASPKSKNAATTWAKERNNPSTSFAWPCRIPGFWQENKFALKSPANKSTIRSDSIP